MMQSLAARPRDQAVAHAVAVLSTVPNASEPGLIGQAIGGGPRCRIRVR
jgi:hypothetical protein